MSELDRIKEPLAAFIRWVMRDTRFAKLYPARVILQDAAGRLELLADDASIKGTGNQGVPIKHGLPGCAVVVPTGARILLGFENADSTRPYAALWEGVTPFTLISIGDFHIETGGTSRAGGGANFVALANLVLSELNAVKTAFDAHTHITTATVSAGAPGVLAVPTPPMPAPGPVASSNLKAD